MHRPSPPTLRTITPVTRPGATPGSGTRLWPLCRMRVSPCGRRPWCHRCELRDAWTRAPSRTPISRKKGRPPEPVCPHLFPGVPLWLRSGSGWPSPPEPTDGSPATQKTAPGTEHPGRSSVSGRATETPPPPMPPRAAPRRPAGGTSGFLKRCHASRAFPAESITSGTWSSSPLTAKSSTEATPAMARMMRWRCRPPTLTFPVMGRNRWHGQPRSVPFGRDRDTSRRRVCKCSRFTRCRRQPKQAWELERSASVIPTHTVRVCSAIAAMHPAGTLRSSPYEASKSST